MVTGKARTIRAGKRTLKQGIKQRFSGRTKPAAMRASKASALTIKETIRIYAPALRRLADR